MYAEGFARLAMHNCSLIRNNASFGAAVLLFGNATGACQGLESPPHPPGQSNCKLGGEFSFLT